MGTKEKEREKYAAGPHMDEVDEPTREWAAWWIHQVELRVTQHGYTWHVPNRVENWMGEVVYEWNAARPSKKTLGVYIENERATYLRHWDWDERGRGGALEEGECTWFDHALLLWHWLYT